MTKTIEKISSELNYSTIPGWRGLPLRFKLLTRDEVSNLKVDEKYQRLISKKKLEEYGQLDFNLLVPTVISCRPSNLQDFSGSYIIDGQHKAEKYYKSGHKGDGIETGFPVITLSHSENSTLKEVLHNEAKLFHALNTQRKKLNKVDELRAGAAWEEETATHVESVMKELNVVVDNFGSSDKNAKELTSFSQFYYTITADYKTDSTSVNKIKSGYELWKEIYSETPKGKRVHGTAFRAICFLHRFIFEGLTNGKQESFYNWCVKELKTEYTQDELVQTFGSFDSPRQVLYRVIDKYNSKTTRLNGKGSQTIGPVTLVNAIYNSGEYRFEHPNEDEWEKVLEKVGMTVKEWKDEKKKKGIKTL